MFKRQTRILSNQKTALVRMLQNFFVRNVGYYVGVNDVDIDMASWEAIAINLNKIGPSKTANQWKNSLSYMKSRIRNKMKTIISCDADPKDNMTEVDLRLYEMFPDIKPLRNNSKMKDGMLNDLTDAYIFDGPAMRAPVTKSVSQNNNTSIRSNLNYQAQNSTIRSGMAVNNSSLSLEQNSGNLFGEEETDFSASFDELAMRAPGSKPDSRNTSNRGVSTRPNLNSQVRNSTITSCEYTAINNSSMPSKQNLRNEFNGENEDFSTDFDGRTDVEPGRKSDDSVLKELDSHTIDYEDLQDESCEANHDIVGYEDELSRTLVVNKAEELDEVMNEPIIIADLTEGDSFDKTWETAYVREKSAKGGRSNVSKGKTTPKLILKTSKKAAVAQTSQRIPDIQRERLVQLVQNNFLKVVGSFSGVNGVLAKRRLWESFANELNTLGPSRNATQWKTTFDNIKLTAKSKLADYHNDDNEIVRKPLSRLEEKLVSIYGLDSLDGEQLLGEGGFKYKKTVPNTGRIQDSEKLTNKLGAYNVDRGYVNRNSNTLIQRSSVSMDRNSRNEFTDEGEDISEVFNETAMRAPGSKWINQNYNTSLRGTSSRSNLNYQVRNSTITSGECITVNNSSLSREKNSRNLFDDEDDDFSASFDKSAMRAPGSKSDSRNTSNRGVSTRPNLNSQVRNSTITSCEYPAINNSSMPSIQNSRNEFNGENEDFSRDFDGSADVEPGRQSDDSVLRDLVNEIWNDTDVISNSSEILDIHSVHSFPTAPANERTQTSQEDNYSRQTRVSSSIDLRFDEDETFVGNIRDHLSQRNVNIRGRNSTAVNLEDDENIRDRSSQRHHTRQICRPTARPPSRASSLQDEADPLVGNDRDRSSQRNQSRQVRGRAARGRNSRALSMEEDDADPLVGSGRDRSRQRNRYTSYDMVQRSMRAQERYTEQIDLNHSEMINLMNRNHSDSVNMFTHAVNACADVLRDIFNRN